MEDLTFMPAVAADLPAVRTLLERCALPTDDLQAAHLTHFILCRAGDALAGAVGLEVVGQVGLLRSLAVAPERRGRRLGHDLWRHVLDEARRFRIQRLYLLTTTAERLFSRWGFERITRDAVPHEIRTTPEFASLCPATAAVMVKDLSAGDDDAATQSNVTRP